MNRKCILVFVAVLLVGCSMVPAQAAAPSAVLSVTPPSTPSAPPVNQLPASASPGKNTANPVTAAATVQERFRSYTGPRTPAALKALFTEVVAANYRQQPAVVLSDGAAMVRISVDIAPEDNSAANVALNGARLISLERITPEELVVEVLPDEGVESASLAIITGRIALEIPITVVPSLPPETDMSEQGFVTFLGANGTNPQPLHDLNADGLRNYLDDYLFTANYLVRSQSKADSGGNARQSAPSPSHPEQIEAAPIPVPDSIADSKPPQAIQETTTTKKTAPQGPTTAPTAYQKNIAIRNQLQRERLQRMKMAPASGAPADATPSPQ